MGPPGPTVIVVDTNVVAYLWLPGNMTAAAEQVLRQDAEWAVPLLWRSEFRSILTGAVRRKAVPLGRGAGEEISLKACRAIRKWLV